MVHGLSCSEVGGIFLDQGSNLLPCYLSTEPPGKPTLWFLSRVSSLLVVNTIRGKKQKWGIWWRLREHARGGVCFPDGSAGKESACNGGDPGSIPGLGRSAGEGKGYPLQYSWVSLMAQMVKNPPAMRENPGLIPGLGGSTGEGKHYPLQYSGLENPTDFIIHGVAKSRTRLSYFHSSSLH